MHLSLSLLNDKTNSGSGFVEALDEQRSAQTQTQNLKVSLEKAQEELLETQHQLFKQR